MTRSLIILSMRALKASGLSKVIRVVESRRSDWIPDVWRSWTIDVGGDHRPGGATLRGAVVWPVDWPPIRGDPEPRRSGGIGRRASLRSWCPQGCGGSSPPSDTIETPGQSVWNCSQGCRLQMDLLMAADDWMWTIGVVDLNSAFASMAEGSHGVWGVLVGRPGVGSERGCRIIEIDVRQSRENHL